MIQKTSFEFDINDKHAFDTASAIGSFIRKAFPVAARLVVPLHVSIIYLQKMRNPSYSPISKLEEVDVLKIYESFEYSCSDESAKCATSIAGANIHTLLALF